jgi:hypothetical protein
MTTQLEPPLIVPRALGPHPDYLKGDAGLRDHLKEPCSLTGPVLVQPVLQGVGTEHVSEIMARVPIGTI